MLTRKTHLFLTYGPKVIKTTGADDNGGDASGPPVANGLGSNPHIKIVANPHMSAKTIFVGVA